MRSLLIGLILVAGVYANAETYCNPEVSFPCGRGCAKLGQMCKYSWSTSKVGINPNRSGGKKYSADQIKSVNVAPDTKK